MTEREIPMNQNIQLWRRLSQREREMGLKTNLELDWKRDRESWGSQQRVSKRVRERKKAEKEKEREKLEILKFWFGPRAWQTHKQNENSDKKKNILEATKKGTPKTDFTVDSNKQIMKM